MERPQWARSSRSYRQKNYGSFVSETGHWSPAPNVAVGSVGYGRHRQRESRPTLYCIPLDDPRDAVVCRRPGGDLPTERDGTEHRLPRRISPILGPAVSTPALLERLLLAGPERGEIVTLVGPPAPLRRIGDPLPIPTYDALMLPVLRHCADKAWTMRELVARISDDLGLTLGERAQQIPSGGSLLVSNRVHWAKTYLKKAGLLSQPARAVVEITPRGREFLAHNPAKIDAAQLEQFDEFRAFLGKTEGSVSGAGISITVPPPVELSQTPEEQITSASRALNESLRDALLTRVLEGTPAFFEKLIVDLLLTMGYGGSRTDAGEQLGGTSDGGVDGVIREDQLGLDRVYLQAKRYKPENTVGSETVQAFIGALVGRGAQKGVLITTSKFSKAAINAANQSGHLRLVLIDGDELTNLLIRFNVGVRIARAVEIKRVDLDYFGDAEPE
jgi:restriction system protein